MFQGDETESLHRLCTVFEVALNLVRFDAFLIGKVNIRQEKCWYTRDHVVKKGSEHCDGCYNYQVTVCWWPDHENRRRDVLNNMYICFIPVHENSIGFFLLLDIVSPRVWYMIPLLIIDVQMVIWCIPCLTVYESIDMSFNCPWRPFCCELSFHSVISRGRIFSRFCGKLSFLKSRVIILLKKAFDWFA